MPEGSKPRPFHERFDLSLGNDEARQRFITRIGDYILVGLLQRRLQSSYPATFRQISEHVAYRLGVRYVIGSHPSTYMNDDYHRSLMLLEAVFEMLEGTVLEDEFTERINNVIRDSEIDLGISWQPPIFVRAGARLLDERLVNEPLRWLSEPRYLTVLEPFERGLSHYLEDRLSDTVTDMYEALEALARIVTGRDRELSGNREMFVSRVRASDYYKQLLRDYITYANQYRHAAQQNRPRPPLSEPEVEAFVYLTGLFIRLAIRQD